MGWISAAVKSLGRERINRQTLTNSHDSCVYNAPFNLNNFKSKEILECRKNDNRSKNYDLKIENSEYINALDVASSSELTVYHEKPRYYERNVVVNIPKKKNKKFIEMESVQLSNTSQSTFSQVDSSKKKIKKIDARKFEREIDEEKFESSLNFYNDQKKPDDLDQEYHDNEDFVIRPRNNHNYVNFNQANKPDEFNIEFWSKNQPPEHPFRHEIDKIHRFDQAFDLKSNQNHSFNDPFQYKSIKKNEFDQSFKSKHDQSFDHLFEYNSNNKHHFDRPFEFKSKPNQSSKYKSNENKQYDQSYLNFKNKNPNIHDANTINNLDSFKSSRTNEGLSEILQLVTTYNSCKDINDSYSSISSVGLDTFRKFENINLNNYFDTDSQNSYYKKDNQYQPQKKINKKINTTHHPVNLEQTNRFDVQSDENHRNSYIKKKIILNHDSSTNRLYYCLRPPEKISYFDKIPEARRKLKKPPDCMRPAWSKKKLYHIDSN